MDSSPLRLHPAPLVIDDPWERVRSFFTLDGSLKYDRYIASETSPANRIVVEDVVAINTSMSARSPHGDWQAHFDRGEIDELEAIATDWSLVEMDADEWDAHDVPRLLEVLFETIIAANIGISRATKVLHIKRPELISVCDSYVLQLLGIPGQTPSSGVAALVHLRAEGRRNLARLRELQDRLRNECDVSRTLVRIIDVLVWGSHPDTWVARRDHRLAVAPAPD